MNLAQRYKGMDIRDIAIGIGTEIVWALAIISIGLIFGTILVIMHSIGWF